MTIAACGQFITHLKLFSGDDCGFNCSDVDSGECSGECGGGISGTCVV